MAYDFLTQQGKEAEAEQWHIRAEKQMEIDEKAAKERSSIKPNDELQGPRQDQETLENLQQQLSEHPKVKEAWIAEKVVTHYPERALYVIAFKTSPLHYFSDTIQADVANSLQTDQDLFIIAYGSDTRKLAKKIMDVGEQII
jgi:hypothetical protein